MRMQVITGFIVFAGLATAQVSPEFAPARPEVSGEEWCAVELLRDRKPEVTFRRNSEGPLEFLGEAPTAEEVGTLIVEVEGCNVVGRLTHIKRQLNGRYAFGVAIRKRS